MRKIFTLLVLLTMFVSGTTAQVTTRATAGNPMTFNEFKALAGTGKHFGIVAVSSNSLTYPKWFSFSTAGYPEVLTTTQLFDLENSATGDGWYNIKRVSDGLYVSTEGGNFNASTKMDFKLVNRQAGDYASEFSSASLHISLDNAAGNHYNANTSNLGFRNGTGGYSAYAAYGPFYVVTVNYLDENSDPLQATETIIVAEGTTIDAPAIAGKAVQGTSSVTVNADQTITFNYAASTYDYTLVVNNAPAGTTMTIKGDPVALDAGNVSYPAAVAEGDVVVTLPAGYDYLTPSVTISGTTITVNCEDTRWPINFSKDQKYTRTDRFINNVRIGSKTFAITNDGRNTPAYRDFTSDVLVVPAGATLVPAIGYEGQWMHGFFYVDLDNDGTFYVENPDVQTTANTEYNGELLSYKNQGNALNNNNQELPAFVMPTTPGDYRARFKVDWASTDPGGNPGADVNDVTSSNHIIANGGTIVDITLRILPPADVTYVVVDESNNELFRATEPAAVGDVITTLPDNYKRTAFYDYNTVNETVTGDMVITFTATMKSDPLVQFTLDTTNPVWYTLKMKDANYVTYVEGGTPNVTLPTTNANDHSTQWAFIGSPYVGFQLVNRAAGTTLVLGSELAGDNDNNGGNTYATLATPGTQAYEVWTLRSSSYITNGFYIFNAADQYLNQRSTDNLAYWTNGHDEGSTFTATLVPSDTELFNQFVNQLEAINWGTGLNQFQLSGPLAGYAGNEAALIAQLKTEGYSDENLAGAQAMLDNKALNLPTAGFYRIKGNTSGLYLASGSASNGKYNMTDATDASTIFYFDGTKLANYGSGLGNGVTASSWAWVTGYDAASDVEFQDGLTNGGYGIKTANAFFYDNGDNSASADRGGNMSISASTNARYTNWYLEAVTEVPFAISAAGQATVCLPEAFTVPAGVTVRYASRAHDGLLTVEDAALTAIPAGEPVILVGDEGAYTLALTTTSETIDGNVLTGTSIAGVAVDASTTAYVLAKPADEVVFAMLNDSERNIAGFKAYYIHTGGGDAPAQLFFDEGAVTGISAVNAAAANGATVYDLQGRRVNAATKGVYIVNGKKVLVK